MENIMNNFARKFILKCILFCFFVALLGCAPKQNVAFREGENLGSKPVHSSKEVKPGSFVVLNSPSIINVLPNEKAYLEASLKTSLLSNQNTAKKLQVTLEADGDFDISASTSPQVFDVSELETYKVPITIMASKNGRFYLRIHVELMDANVGRSQNLILIVQAGESEKILPPIEKAKTHEAAENITALPAIENFKRK